MPIPKLPARCIVRCVVLCTALTLPVATAPAQDKAAAGEKVYSTYCQVCHGDDLVSTGQIFDLRRLKPDDRGRFDNSVRNGKNQMPPWKDVLNDQQIDAIWAYIRSVADR